MELNRYDFRMLPIMTTICCKIFSLWIFIMQKWMIIDLLHYFCSMFTHTLLLLTITRKDDIFNITFLCDSVSSLHNYHILEVCWSVIEIPRSNVIQISEKCWKRPLSKNVDPKAVRHFEENNYQGDDLHLNLSKIV